MKAFLKVMLVTLIAVFVIGSWWVRSTETWVLVYSDWNSRVQATYCVYWLGWDRTRSMNRPDRGGDVRCDLIHRPDDQEKQQMADLDAWSKKYRHTYDALERRHGWTKAERTERVHVDMRAGRAPTLRGAD